MFGNHIRSGKLPTSELKHYIRRDIGITQSANE
jgi:hypothetical protein